MELRVADPADAGAIRDVYAPYVESTPISFEVEPPTVAAMRERVETTLERYPWLVCEDGDGVVGYAAAGSLRSMPAYRWTAELSVYVAEDAQNAGVGTALYEALLATLERQGYYNAYAAITVPNPASRRLHERMGFERVGTFPGVGYKHGEWHGVEWWHRRLAERPSDPDPPELFPDLPESAVDAALAAGNERLAE